MVETGTVLKTVGKGIAVVVALLLVSSLVLGGLVAGGVVELEPPAVSSVNTQWGEVTQDSTEIQTAVVVNNPNPVGVPGVMRIAYSAKMNDVVLAQGEKNGVGLSTGNNTIELSTQMQNEAIAEWWVTHVNNGESSTMSITANVDGPMGISKTIPVSDSTFETNLLENLASGEQRTISMGGEEFLVLKDQTASWGQADSETTPLTFTATVENVHDYPVSLDGLGYTVQMNDVTVGNGSQTDGVSVAPGETATITVTAAIDTPKMADWWATHVRNGESSNLSVTMFGFVEDDGERTRLPMNFMETDLAFDTAILEGGGTSVEPIEGASSEQGQEFGAPTVESTDREWGTVTDGTTEVDTTISIENPNGAEFSELLSVEMGQTVTINDVVVSEGSATFDSFEPGTNGLSHVASLDNSKVPEWWAKHVNNGERTTIEMAPRATADVAFTKFDVALDGRTTTMETDMLAGLNNNDRQSFSVEGREVAVITKTRATWGDATTDETPITVDVTIENTERVPVTLKNLDYLVQFNDVTVADKVAPEQYTIAPGEKRTITFTLVLDSQQMDEWWVSHIENGEQTTVKTSAKIDVEALGTTETREISSMDTSQALTTDILAEES